MDYNEEYEIDLIELFYVLKAKIVTIAVCSLIGAIIAALISLFVITPTYKSTSKLYILTKSTSITSIMDIQVGTSLASDYVELIKSRPVVEKVITNLNLQEIDYDTMLQKVSVANKTDTRILEISATDADPEVAKNIANEFASVSKTQISDIMRTDEPTEVEQGIAEDKPVSPQKTKNTIIGFLLGFIASCAYVIVRHLMDDTVKTPEDVEKYLEIEVLGNIPMRKDEEPAKRKKKEKSRIGKKKKLVRL